MQQFNENYLSVNNSTAKTALAHETGEIMVYEHPLFGKIRMFIQNGKSWFCGLDVATSLQYSNPSKAISYHCKPSSITIREVGVQTGLEADGTPAIQMKSMKFISEGNIYRLIAKSQMPRADEFESWIFDEIIPSVINTGSYSIQDGLPNFNNPAEAARAWADEYERNQALTLENKEAKLQLELKTEQLDESKEWYSIKRWSKENGVNWRKVSWRKMEVISYELGYEVKKIFDANYGQVNIYNVNVFKAYFNKCE